MTPELKPTQAETPRESVLREAIKLTTGDRNVSYGPPTADFDRSVAMLNALFGDILKQPLTSSDVAKIVIIIKLSRSRWMAKRDNWVDIAGYAACGYECDVANDPRQPG